MAVTAMKRTASRFRVLSKESTTTEAWLAHWRFCEVAEREQCARLLQNAEVTSITGTSTTATMTTSVTQLPFFGWYSEGC